MKTENLYIECENAEQRYKIVDTALKNGFACNYKLSNLLVSISTSGKLVFENSKHISFNQFMAKYGNTMNEFKKVVAEAKEKLGVCEADLSRMLGFSRNYINQAILEGRSTKWQESTIVKIDALSKGEVLVDKDEIITQLKKDKEQLVVHNGKLVEEIGLANAIKVELQKSKTILVKRVNDERKIVEKLNTWVVDLKKNNESNTSDLMGKIDVLQQDKVELAKECKKLHERISNLDFMLSVAGSERMDAIDESKSLKQDKDGLKGQIVSLEKINEQYRNKYAASVTIGLMIASVLICVILWGGV